MRKSDVSGCKGLNTAEKLFVYAQGIMGNQRLGRSMLDWATGF